MDAVTQSGFKAQMIVSGAGDYKYLDILSVHGGKRKAMEYVRSIFGIRPERVVAAGDSGNDILMLEGVPASLHGTPRHCCASALYPDQTVLGYR